MKRADRTNINERMAYNCGEAGARRLWRKGITSTAYSRKVLAKMAEIEEADGK